MDCFGYHIQLGLQRNSLKSHQRHYDIIIAQQWHILCTYLLHIAFVQSRHDRPIASAGN